MKIKINTNGAAFSSDEGDEEFNNYYVAEQLKHIFNSIVDKVRSGCDSGRELDINGNRVCSWEI